MVADEAETIGRRIRDARGRAGLTQGELAAVAQIDRSAMSKIEAGARGVSALELARIADAFGERIEWFLSDAPPPVVSRRNLQEPGAPSPAIDVIVERIARELEFVVAHGQLDLPAVEPLSRPGTNAAADGAALAARHLLGFDADEPAPG